MCTANGGRIGLRTRADTVFEDLRIMGPTYVSEVPRFYEVLYSEFQALWSKKRAKFIRKNPIYTPQELNAEREKVMVQMREHLGTRLRFVLCGGAPLSSEVSAFLRECWGTNLFREGYGTTEAGQIANGEGVLYPYVQYKIVDCPEMGYTKKDFPYPRGEILVKTPKMRSSFFRNSEETARSFDSEGYFRTGDIVELINPRTIRIIDRKKSIFKLSQGEFVSPVKIENAITKSRFVNSAFATYASASGSGSSSKKKNVIIAVVVVIEDTVRREAPPELRDLPLEELCADKAVIEMIFCDVVKACGSSRLRPFEIPLAVHLECQPWTPESGLLTQSSKVNRAALEKKYKAVVQRLADACAAGEGATMKDDGIVETVASILGISQDDVDKGNIVQTFLRSGGDSMSAIRLTSALSDKFGIQMKPADLFDASLGPVPKFMSVNTISNTLSSRVTDVSEDEGSKMKLLYDVLREDAAALDIPRDWEPRLKAHPVLAPVASPAAPLNVFLTGATGFIGVHVLERLFNVERARVFCLVRCSDEAAGVAKLRAVMDKYRIALNEDKDAKFEGLVKVIPGDLAAEDEHCGMSDESVKLVTSVRNLLFIHCGAYVNHILPYSALRNTNVCGTKKMLRLAYRCPGSSFTYVSTASTIMGLDLMPLM